MKNPSPLGVAIKEAIDGDCRFVQHREPIQYLCCYRTQDGRVFAFERVTKTQITLWMPEIATVRSVAEAAGLKVTRSEPHSNGTEQYGRLSSLASIPELKDSPLYRIAVTTPGQATAIVGALA